MRKKFQTNRLANYLLAFGLIIFHCVCGQEPIIRHFSYKQLGASTLVWNVVQDDQGLLYLANNEGVIIYDGSSWQLVPTPNPVRSLAIGPNKIILVGCKEDLGALMPNDKNDYSYQSFLQIKDLKTNFNEVLHIHVVGNQVNYITDKNIFKVDLNDSKRTAAPLQINFSTEGVGSVATEVWLYSEQQGTKKISNNQLQNLNLPKEILSKGIYKVFPGKNKQKYYLITLTDEIYVFQNGSFQRMATSVDAEFAKSHIIDATTFSNGNLAIATYTSGVYLLSSTGDLLKRISKSNNLIPDNNIYSVFVDKQENLWIGHARGISHLLFSLPIQTYKIDNVGGKITSLLEHNNQLYCTATTGAYQLINNSFSSLANLQNIECWKIEAFQSGLFVASNEGIYQLQNNTASLIFKDKPVYFLKAQNNLLWFAGQDCAGWLSFENGKINIQNLLQNVSLEANSIVKDGNGTIWIGTNYKGLMQLIPPSTAKFYSVPEGIPTSKTIVHLINNQLIVETSKGYFYTQDKQKFVSYEALKHAKPHLLAVEPLLLAYDKDGIISYKIQNNVLSADTISLLRYRREPPHAAFLTNTYAWIAFHDALYKIIFANHKPLPAKTFIRKFETDTEILYGGLKDFKQKDAGSITVSYGENMKIMAGSNDFLSGENLRYQLKIGGLIEHWSEWQHAPTFTMSGLTEGHYTFHIRAQLSDGTIAQPDLIHVYISPPWYRTYAAYTFYLLSAIGILWLLIQYNLKRLEVRNQELAQKIEEATHEIQEQKRELEEINKEVEQSIQYAKRIQEATLPSPEMVKECFDVSILYKPRDIVSGDFYFFDYQGENYFLVAADCTGHGVPGALMSMLGQNSLQSIITENSISEPAEILQLLDLRVQVLLHQQQGQSKDGMDMCLVKFNKNTRWLEFAGANRPLIIIKNSGEFIEMKPDRFPIGGDQYPNKSFTPRNIQLEAKDRFFMFSDGITDQFGGLDNKKFGIKKFREVLKENMHKSLHEQILAVNNAYVNWALKTQQTDDILVIGFEVR